MDLALFTLMIVKDLDLSGEHNAVMVCNVIAIILSFLVCGLPIFFVIFIALKLKSLNDEKFKKKFGSLVEGSNHEMKKHQWIVVLIPATYYLRRLGMCLCLVF